MRPSVSLFCLAVLTLCAVIVGELRVSRTSPNRAPKSVAPAERQFVHQPAKSERVVTVAPANPAPAPSWELRFGEIADQPEGMQSQEELEELADSIPKASTRAALEELSTDPSGASLIVARRLLQRWTEESFAGASQWVGQLPDNNFGHALCRELAVSWAQTNFEAAVSWMGQLEKGNKVAAELSLAQAAAGGKDPVATIDLIADVPPSPERDHLLTYATRRWASLDPTDAAAWLDAVPDDQLRGQMLKNVALDMAVAAPFDAAQFVATRPPSENEQAEVVGGIVRFWAASAPDQAADWVAQFPETRLKNLAVANLMEVWKKQDSAQADAWFKQFGQ